jgi:hypothetical protein
MQILFSFFEIANGNAIEKFTAEDDAEFGVLVLKSHW